MKILLIDDEKSMHVALAPFLEELGHETASAFTGAEGRQMARDLKPDLILLDIYLPDINGLELLEHFRKDHPNVGVVIMTAAAAIKTAVEAIRSGAEDYLQKPLNLDDLQIVLARSAEKLGLRKEVAVLRRYLQDQFAHEYLFLSDPAMAQVYEKIEQLAQLDKVTALVLGETGTGKEHAAKLIHYLSPRSAKPFVELHCGALPETLMESELFGYEAGAFTDARKQKLGLFEAAQGGSLFLDEVGEMPISTQTKLLKVLEDHKLRRLGGLKEITLDVRIIAATNRNLEHEIKEGRFRADLYYRLNVIPLKLPPLRSRPNDVAELAHFFWKEACQAFDKKLDLLPLEVIQELQAYPWPGNVRELKNAINRMVINTRGPRITVGDIPDEIMMYEEETLNKPPEGEDAEPSSPDEKDRIEKALLKTKWNKSRAAELLGISRKTLFNKIKKHSL
jgi:two-component system response regulator AtoC